MAAFFAAAAPICQGFCLRTGWVSGGGKKRSNRVGFNGRGPVRLAFEQGEVNIDYQFHTSLLRTVLSICEEGTAVPLWTAAAPMRMAKLTQT